MKNAVNIEITTDSLRLSETALLYITNEEAVELDKIARAIAARARLTERRSVK